jgi:magnesium-transporting ATPase (P-type)
MVTGDNLLTAQAYAKDVGILDRNYEPGTTKSYEVLEGKDFREMVGGLKSEK